MARTDLYRLIELYGKVTVRWGLLSKGLKYYRVTYPVMGGMASGSGPTVQDAIDKAMEADDA